MASQYFTPAAQRAFAAAAAWTSGHDCDELQPLELLLGLLAETECRAATLLAAKGIDREAVLRRWPAVRPAREHVDEPVAGPAAGPADGPADGDRQSRGQFSQALLSVIAAAEDRLWEYPRPLELATEHLLLGLLAAKHETGQWLVECGFSVNVLEAEIHRWYGHRPGPLAVEVLDTAAAGHERQAAPETATRESIGRATAENVQPTSNDAVPLLRVIDAAANRAREGLRVVEDYARLVLDDRHLTGELKQLRHELAATLACLPAADRLASRETLQDVGTGETTPSEFTRPDVASVVAANFARLQESLRTLEEYTKILDTDAARRLETLRYRAYTLERAVDITRRGNLRLAAVRLYVLVDARESSDEFQRRVESLVAAGVHAIQLRDKSLTDRELMARARLLRALTRGDDTLFIMNDRPDVAALVGADGVHVGQDDFSVKDARTVVGPRALVGVSTHSLAQARQAVLDGADYIGVGPTFPSGTKSFEVFPGVELLRAVADEIRLPAFAIGGIDRTNLDAVLASGFSRVAVGGAVWQATDPAADARELLDVLNAPRVQIRP